MRADNVHRKLPQRHAHAIAQNRSVFLHALLSEPEQIPVVTLLSVIYL
ncbi:hypothetical protein GCAAIG_04365 [Candidatus Electronema halotolerans]